MTKLVRKIAVNALQRTAKGKNFIFPVLYSLNFYTDNKNISNAQYYLHCN
jgi:hypothetical protein